MTAGRVITDFLTKNTHLTWWRQFPPVHLLLLSCLYRFIFCFLFSSVSLEMGVAVSMQMLHLISYHKGFQNFIMLWHKILTVITLDSAFSSNHTNVKMSFMTVKTVKQYALIRYWSSCFPSKDILKRTISTFYNIHCITKLHWHNTGKNVKRS